MVRVGNFLVRYRQSISRAVAGEIGGLLAQQRQLGAADHQRQRF